MFCDAFQNPVDMPTDALGVQFGIAWSRMLDILQTST